MDKNASDLSDRCYCTRCRWAILSACLPMYSGACHPRGSQNDGQRNQRVKIIVSPPSNRHKVRRRANLRPPFLFTFYRATKAPPAPHLLAMHASKRSSNYQGRNSPASHCFSIALSSSTSVFLQNTNGDPTYSKTRHGMCCRHRL
jgi:hypothetical protein